MNDSYSELDQIAVLKNLNTKSALAIILGISVIASLFLVWLIYFNEGIQTEMQWTSNLPYLNATLNSISTMLLIFGIRAIKQKKFQLHLRLMVGAFISSAFFLVSYIVYHTFQGDTSFEAQGFIRYIYFSILITHVLLSLFVVPLVLTTFYFSLSGKYKLHRKIAKITFPIWLYVSVTGVIIVFMLKLFNLWLVFLLNHRDINVEELFNW